MTVSPEAFSKSNASRAVPADSTSIQTDDEGARERAGGLVDGLRTDGLRNWTAAREIRHWTELRERASARAIVSVRPPDQSTIHPSEPLSPSPLARPPDGSEHSELRDARPVSTPPERRYRAARVASLTCAAISAVAPAD